MTALRALGPEPMAFAYGLQPSRRPTDGVWRKPERLQRTINSSGD